MIQAEAAKRIGVTEAVVHGWAIRYKANGVQAFRKQKHNSVYSEELKTAAVRAYLDGKGSLQEISAKYGLRSKTQLQNWIKVYNSGRDFDRKMSGGSRMRQAYIHYYNTVRLQRNLGILTSMEKHELFFLAA